MLPWSCPQHRQWLRAAAAWGPRPAPEGKGSGGGSRSPGGLTPLPSPQPAGAVQPSCSCGAGQCGQGLPRASPGSRCPPGRRGSPIRGSRARNGCLAGLCGIALKPVNTRDRAADPGSVASSGSGSAGVRVRCAPCAAQCWAHLFSASLPVFSSAW